MVVLPPGVACFLKVHPVLVPCLVRSLPLRQEGSLCANKRARVMCSKGTFSACQMSVCEKTCPSAPGLTESKLQSIEEAVSVRVSRRGARSDGVSLPPCGENLGGSLASGSALSKWSCAESRREHELSMVQSFRRPQRRQMLLQVFRAWEKHRAMSWPRRQVPKLSETVWMMPRQ